MKRISAVVFIGIVVIARAGFGAQVVNGWSINTDNSGNVATMSYENPRTQLNIEAVIDITLDYQGAPAKGHVKFKDGVERDLIAPEEPITYFSMLGGPNAIWDYLKSQGKVTIIDPQSGPIPATCYGRMSRVISKDGREYIGKISEMPSNPDWFTMNIEGRTLTVWRLAVREILQM